MPEIILHNYRRCPFCIRVRIILFLGQIPHQIVEERLRNWTDKIKNLENPCVPILDFDGEIIRESNRINQFLDEKFCQKKYTHAQDQKWFEWCDEKFKPAIDQYKYANPKTREWDRRLSDIGAEKLRECLSFLEQELSITKNLNSDEITLSDIAIIPFVRQIMRTRNGEFNFEFFPRVVAWTNAILDQDWFQEEVMKKHPFAKEKI